MKVSRNTAKYIKYLSKAHGKSTYTNICAQSNNECIGKHRVFNSGIEYDEYKHDKYRTILNIKINGASVEFKEPSELIYAITHKNLKLIVNVDDVYIECVTARLAKSFGEDLTTQLGSLQVKYGADVFTRLTKLYEGDSSSKITKNFLTQKYGLELKELGYAY